MTRHPSSAPGEHRGWFVLGFVVAGSVAVVFATIGDGVASDGEGNVVLEHGHAGVWVLLCAALGWAALVGRWQRVSSLLATCALLLYGTFLVALVTS